MPLPAINVSTIDQPPTLSAVLDDRQVFLAMENYRGTLEPRLFRSPRDVARYIEPTDVGIPAYDAVDVLLREGVPRVWLSRIVGPDAAYASIDLDDSTAAVSVTLTAKEPGEWANGSTGGLKAAVVDDSGDVIIVIYRGGSTSEFIVEQSPSCSTRAQIVTWGETSAYVSAALGVGTGLPDVAAATNLAGGDSDSANITTTEVTEALERYTADYGPGQVMTPGRTTVGTSTALLDFCQGFDRTALVEVESGLSVSATAAITAQLRALGSGAEGTPRLGGAWCQSASGPGRVSGSTRTVPWTLIVAGQIARAQTAAGHPNVDPIGAREQAMSRWATTVDRYFTPAEMETLVDAGCNVVDRFQDNPFTLTFRTLEEDGATDWIDLAHTRLERYIRAQLRDIGRQMQGDELAADWGTINQFASYCRDKLSDIWKLGALYGVTASDAFIVDATSVNDDETIAAREVNISVGVKMSPHAEFVNLFIAKIPLGQAL